MTADPGLTELRRGVLGPCVLAMLEVRPRFGLELVRDLGAAGGLLPKRGLAQGAGWVAVIAGLVTANQAAETARATSLQSGSAAPRRAVSR